jgi:two-component system, OmpR family, phosphate regulon sensor histidine kinase PhoR
MKRLWNSSLIFKFLLSYLAIIALLFASFYFYSEALVKDLYISSLGVRMERESRLLAKALPFELEGAPLDALTRSLSDELGARITIIALDGRVLGNSAEPAEGMENHAGRPEVVDALAKGSGSAIRHSTTVGYDLFYRAILQTEGSRKRIVRLAFPLAGIEKRTSALERALLIGLLTASALALLVAYVFFRHFSRRLGRLVEFSRQVAGGTIPHDFFSTTGRDEINLLERHLNEMGRKLRDHIQQIVAEKEKADSILRCMIESVLVLDPKGRVLVINEQAKRMFQVPPGRDVQGASIAELSRHPEMLAVMREALEVEFANRGYSKEVELDEGRWVSVNAVSLKDGAQEVCGSILVFHDISEIKRLELVRSDLVANVSHELRTPLTAIRGYVETLLRTPPEDPVETRHFLGVIERNTERLSRLTEDLLTLSDLESGKLPLARRPVDIAQLAQRVLEVFWNQANVKNLELNKQIEPGLPPLLGDFDRLQQLFINLIDNAVKYTPSGGKVALKAAKTPAAPGAPLMVQLSVSDTGPGIPANDIPRLTERFYRVDKARSRELGGTGLGLAIVKHIVQAHQGKLKIESVMQKGTTVHVQLPAVQPETDHKNILFLCTGNSCRSQMAEGFARRLAVNGHRIYSAGTEPKPVHPLAVEVMKEAGIDISNQSSKGLDAVPLDSVNLLITLCGDAAETCPAVAIDARRDHWPLPDPALARGDEEHILKVFRDVRDAIRARVEGLLIALANEGS